MTTRSPYSRLSHSGTAPDTTLASGVDASTLTVALIDGTGWPDGSAGSFVVIFEPGSSNEEKAVALSRSGNTLTLSQRGLEGAAVSHTASAVIRHGLSAVEVDEANYAVSQTVGQVAAKGDLLQGFGANQLRRVPGGSAGQAPVYQADGSIAAGNPAPAAHTHAEADVGGLPSDLSALSSAVSANTTNIANNTSAITVLQNTPNGLLAHVDYTSTSATLGTSLAVVDATNLSAAFTVPSSGKALIRVSGACNLRANSSLPTLTVGWLNHTGGAQVGRSQSSACPSPNSLTQFPYRFACAQTLTGLTPGAFALDLAAQTGIGVSANLTDVTIEVWAA